MASFENLRREELMILTKLRNADDYKNMSREQLKYIFATLSVTKASPLLAPRPTPGNKNLPQDLKNIQLSLLQELRSIYVMTMNKKNCKRF